MHERHAVERLSSLVPSSGLATALPWTRSDCEKHMVIALLFLVDSCCKGSAAPCVFHEGMPREWLRRETRK